MSHGSSNHGHGFGSRSKISEYVHTVEVPSASQERFNTGEESGAKATEYLQNEEKYISSRVQEMSQEDSPALRELAFRLGNMMKVETPRRSSKRRHPYAHLNIGDRSWQVMQGCNDWSRLLDPIDEFLKAEIIRYGEFAQATYDAFDGQKGSKTYGNSKHDKDSLLESVGLNNRGYDITNFLYATTDFHFANFFNKVNESFRGGSSHEDENAPSRQSNWIGFVAVCTSPDEISRLGRRDIAIVWRGTTTVFEWIKDVMDFMSPAGFGPLDACSHVKVEAGFLSVYTSKNNRSQHNKTSSARDQVLEAVKDLVEKYKHESQLSITVTGHSLGSALATLCAYDIAESNVNLLSDTPSAPKQWYSGVSRPDDEDDTVRHSHTEAVRNVLHSIVHHHSPLSDEHGKHRQRFMQGVKNLGCNEIYPERNRFETDKIPITVYSFAGPRVGNRAFRDRIDELGVAVLRVVNVHDVVTKLPGLKHISKFSEYVHDKVSLMPSYKHVGVKLVVDHERSPYLKASAGLKASLMQSHCLEMYLHLVDAYNSSSKTVPYNKCFRDVALVNKSSDFLRDEYLIPPCWWKDGNTVLARDSNGNWLFPERQDGTVHMPAKPEDEYAEFWQKVDAARAKSQAATVQHCF